MVSCHDIEEVETRIRAGWYVDHCLLCKAKNTLNYKSPPRCGKILNMSQNKKEIPVWFGGESGQRKRYLKSLEMDLAAELGPDWRDKIADSAES